MSTTMNATLNAKTFPPQGLRLIEASAGTGKTYTIANLYLRLLLEPYPSSQEALNPVPLSVDQILVVTFTDAATGELRDRIRARIHDTRNAFMAGNSQDDFIQYLIDTQPEQQQSINLLQAAERQMDEAAIFTIHGFCQRMLKQHAFESGTLFTTELLDDEGPLLEAATQDFWRRTVYPMDKPLASLARHYLKTPEALLSNIRSWLNKPGLQIVGNGVPDDLAAFKRQYIDRINAIKALWRQEKQHIGDLLRNCGLGKKRLPYSKLSAMEEFIETSALVPRLGSGNSNKGWEVYSSGSLESALSKKGTFPKHAVFPMIDQLVEQPLSIDKAFENMMLTHALKAVKHQLAQSKAQRHQQSYNDLLSNLEAALTGEQGPALAQAIRSQYPVAMIDEFQDTDPQQYAIFTTLYADNTHDSGLFMIGDPKQAIYAFRGADIFTYIKARRQVSAHYTLDTNWRSSASMIAGVNHCFEQARAPFIYDNDIPFFPVNVSPRGQGKSLSIDGKVAPALHLWLDENEKTAMGAADYQAAMSLATATEINRLLTLADQGRCLLHDEKSSRPLRAGDIAVLVRTKKHGTRVRKQLAEQGITSIYLSNSDSVFHSQEAKDMLRILSACLSPTDERTLRAALATSLLNLNAEALEALNSDELLWEKAVEEFTDYQQRWFNQGILSMLRHLIHRREVAENLLTSSFGERQLTDALHLGELLADKALELDSHHGLLHWLAEMIDTPNDNAAEQQLHLESERNLVKISTIHKSKGLEYNVVFIPMPCLAKVEKQALYHDDKGGVMMDLLNPKEGQEKADQERLAEDLRLLYVALTRSVYRCYLGLAPVKSRPSGNKTDLHQTSIGWLINGGEPIEADSLQKKVESLAADSPDYCISKPPAQPLPSYQPPKRQAPRLDALTFEGTVERHWWITSYSALIRHSAAHTPARSGSDTPDASLEQVGFDTEVSNERADSGTGDSHTLFDFPKGAKPGTFLHTLFERVDFAEKDRYTLTAFVKEQLLMAGYEEVWCSALCTLLYNCLNTPLDGYALRLSDIPLEHRKVEMEFILPVHQLEPKNLNQLIQQHDPISATLPELDFQQVKGMLKGFIDLTFVHEGKWYVLDYKSNWLGNTTNDYSYDNMKLAMAAHRYDLQYQLYCLALHRLLQQRMVDYDYEQHFGGVFYLFLRGITLDGANRQGIFYHRPSQSLIKALDNLFKTGVRESAC